MSQLISPTASCLCQGVTIHAKNINPKFTVCHCGSCRKWGGGPLFMLHCGADVTFEGEGLIKEYDSSPWATRAFCLECGTHLFSRYKKAGVYNIPVGLFPKTQNLEMDMQYFIDLKPEYYCFSNDTPTMTDDEIKVHFAAEV